MPSLSLLDHREVVAPTNLAAATRDRNWRRGRQRKRSADDSAAHRAGIVSTADLDHSGAYLRVGAQSFPGPPGGLAVQPCGLRLRLAFEVILPAGLVRRKVGLAKDVAAPVWPGAHPDRLTARRAPLLRTRQGVERSATVGAVGSVVLVHRNDYGPDAAARLAGTRSPRGTSARARVGRR